jgi:phage-related protein
MGEVLSLPHSRPMPSIAKNCHELRIQDKTVTWRIIYLIEGDAIVILDIFAKKTAQTPLRVIQTCKERLKLYKANDKAAKKIPDENVKRQQKGNKNEEGKKKKT